MAEQKKNVGGQMLAAIANVGARVYIPGSIGICFAQGDPLKFFAGDAYLDYHRERKGLFDIDDFRWDATKHSNAAGHIELMYQGLGTTNMVINDAFAANLEADPEYFEVRREKPSHLVVTVPDSVIKIDLYLPEDTGEPISITPIEKLRPPGR